VGVDLTAEQLSPGIHGFEGTAKSWVKCHRCSAALGRPYPVEAMVLEGGESPRLGSSRYRMVVRVSCHMEEMRVALEVPTWWAEGMRFQALAYVYAFVLGDGRYRAEVRKGTRGQSAGALSTEVR
jgi:hypothetical protein